MKITLIFLFLTFSISQWIIGENGQGELGTGQSGQSAGNVREGPIFYNSALTNQGLQIINLCQGETFSLAISSNGSVFGTGANWNGQLGINSTTSVFSWTKLTSPLLVSILGVECGITTSYAWNLTHFFSWGRSSSALGLGETNKDQLTPQLIITPLPNPRKVCAGNDYALFHTVTDDVYSCGYDTVSAGQIDAKNVPTFMLNAIQVSCGVYHSLVLVNSSTLYGFGANSNGELGLGYFSGSITYGLMSKDINIQNVHTHTGTSYVLLENGTILSTGYNNYGMLGWDISDLTLTKSNQLRIAYPLEGKNITSISSGFKWANFLTRDGNVFSTGGGEGNGLPNSYAYNPVTKLFLYGIKHISASKSFGRYSAMFYNTSNSIYCYGVISTSPDVCSGKGVCLEMNNCTCRFGWNGTICNIEDGYICNGISSKDPSVCSKNGDCISKNNCKCKTGFTGSKCQYLISENNICFGVKATEKNVCSGFGVCIQTDLCICDKFSRGVNCQYQDFHWDNKFSYGKWSELKWKVDTENGMVLINRFPVLGDSVYLDLPGDIIIDLDLQLFNLSSVSIGKNDKKTKYDLNLKGIYYINGIFELNEGSNFNLKDTLIYFKENAFNYGKVNIMNSKVIYNKMVFYLNDITVPKLSSVVLNSQNVQIPTFIIEGEIELNGNDTNPNINTKSILINSGSFQLNSNIILTNTFINISNGNFNHISGEMRGIGMIHNYGYYQIITNLFIKIEQGIRFFNFKTFEINGGGYVECINFIQGETSLFSLRGSNVRFKDSLVISKGSIKASGMIDSPLVNITTTGLVSLYSDKSLEINGSLHLSESSNLILELTSSLKDSEKIIVKNVIFDGLIYMKIANGFNIEVGDNFKFLKYIKATKGIKMRTMLIGSAYKTADLRIPQDLINRDSILQDINGNFKSLGFIITLSLGNIEYSDIYKCNYLGNRRIIEVVHFKKNQKVSLTLTTPAKSGWNGFGFNLRKNVTNSTMMISLDGSPFEMYDHKSISQNLDKLIDVGYYKVKSLFNIGKEYISLSMFLDEGILMNQTYLFYVENEYSKYLNSTSHFTESFDFDLLNGDVTPCTNFLSPNRLETRHEALITLKLFYYVVLFILCLLFSKIQPLLSRGLAPIATLLFLMLQMAMETRSYDFIPVEQRSLCLYFGYGVYPLQQLSFALLIYYFIRFFSIISLNNIKNNIKIVNVEGNDVLRYSWRVILLKQFSKVWFAFGFTVLYIIFSLIINTIILASSPKYLCYFETISNLKVVNSVSLLLIFLILSFFIIGDIVLNYKYIIRCSLITYIFKTDPFYFRLQIILFLPFMIFTLASEIYILFRIRSFIETVQYNRVTEVLNSINFGFLVIIDVIFPLVLTIIHFIIRCFQPYQKENTIKFLLKDPQGFDLFIEFSKKEYSVENVYAWKECIEFQENYLKDKSKMKNDITSSSHNLKEISQNLSFNHLFPKEQKLTPEEYNELYYSQAQQIYIKYLNGINSLFEVNIPKSTCSMIKDMIDLQMIDETLFDFVIEDILLNLNDIYYRFQQSNDYKLYISKIKLESELLEKEKINDNFIVKKIEEKKHQNQQNDQKFLTKKMKLEEIRKKKMDLKKEMENQEPIERKKSVVQIMVEKVLGFESNKGEEERKKSVFQKIEELKKNDKDYEEKIQSNDPFIIEKQ